LVAIKKFKVDKNAAITSRVGEWWIVLGSTLVLSLRPKKNSVKVTETLA